MENRIKKRHKVFFCNLSDIWRDVFSDIYFSCEYEYCSFDTTSFSKIKRLFINTKLLSILPHFLKRTLYRVCLRYDFLSSQRDAEILFVFNNSFEMYTNAQLFLLFLDYLKKEYPKSKFALYYYDAIISDEAKHLAKVYQDWFDLLLTFNRFDAGKFNYIYYGPVSEHNENCLLDAGVESDVFYAGSASWKRIDLLTDVFKLLADSGKKCVFFITYEWASEAEQKKYYDFLCRKIGVLNPDSNSMVFYNNESVIYTSPINYVETIPYVIKTKTILEVIDPNVEASCTNRLAQAMIYNKKLLTNSRDKYLLHENFYNPNNIFLFSKPDDIDLSFLNADFVPIQHDFSGLYMMKSVEQQLFGNVYDINLNDIYVLNQDD